MAAAYPHSYGLEVNWSAKELAWAHAVETEGCNWRCRLSELPKAQALYTQRTHVSSPCERCDEQPYSSFRRLAVSIWARLREGMPLRWVPGEFNTEALQCPDGPGVQVNGRSKCIVGYMAYALLCFLHYFGKDLPQAYIYLEIAMDIAKFVKESDGSFGACGQWGFTPLDTALNYELHMVSGWHEHNTDVPHHLEKWHTVRNITNAGACPRARPMEFQEMAVAWKGDDEIELSRYLAAQCTVGACESDVLLAETKSSTMALCQATCANIARCRLFAFCPAGPLCRGARANHCALYPSCQKIGTDGGPNAGYKTCGWGKQPLLRDVPPSRPRVQCLVLALLPQESERVATVAETYASDCDSLYFVTASDGPDSLHGYPVVDIRKYFPEVPSDPVESAGSDATFNVNTANTVYKTLLLFLLADILKEGETDEPDVTCRLDADTFFVPDNLRRIVACRGFSCDAPWALGHVSYVHKHQAPGAAFPYGGSGICLSRGAVRAYRNFYKAGGIQTSAEPGMWATGACTLAPGHWDDVTLGVCLRLARISLSRWSADCRGRELFWPLEYEMALRAEAPKGPTRVALAGGQGISGMFNFWRYRVLQYFSCENDVWLGEYPVSYHGRLCNRTMKRALYDSIRSGLELPGGRVLRVWDGVPDDNNCADLLC